MFQCLQCRNASNRRHRLFNHLEIILGELIDHHLGLHQVPGLIRVDAKSLVANCLSDSFDIGHIFLVGVSGLEVNHFKAVLRQLTGMCCNLFRTVSLDKPHETHRVMDLPTQQGMNWQAHRFAKCIPKGQFNTCKRNIAYSWMRLAGVVMSKILRKELLHQIDDLSDGLPQQDRFGG